MSFRSPFCGCPRLAQCLALLVLWVWAAINGTPSVLAQRFDCQEGNCVYRPLFRIRAVVHGHGSDPFWQRVASAMEQTGRDMNVDLTVQFHPGTVYDGQVMADQVTATATADPAPDAMIVTIPDNFVQKAVGDIIETTNVPVFGLNTGADVQTIYTKGFVAMDDRLAGATAGDAFRQQLDSSATSTERSAAPTALFVNHAFGSLQQENQRIGLEQSLDGAVLALDDISFVPEESDRIPQALGGKLAGCPYRMILLTSGTLLDATLSALTTHQCPEDTLVGIIATSESGSLSNVYEAIGEGKVAFVITEHFYLEGALPVVMGTLFATTGKKLAEPGSEYGNGAYLAGPKVVTKKTLPSRQQQLCESEGYPVCPNTKGPDGVAQSQCPCFDRKKLVLAGVNHGVTTSAFWDEVFAASLEAARDFRVDLRLPRIEEQGNDTIVHEKMAELIAGFCQDGVDGLFVSLPSDVVLDSVQKCLDLGIPVMSVNSGADYAEKLGLLAHIGQLEFRGGQSAGNKLIDAGVKRGMCVYQEENNVGLFERCNGMQQAFNESNIEFLGSIFAPPSGDAEAYRTAVEDMVGEDGDWDGVGILLGGTLLIPQALQIQKVHPSLRLGSFDVDSILYDALNEKTVLFGIDQNSYLQGYLPIPLLAWFVQTGQILNNQFIESGPDFLETAPSEAAIECRSTYYEACAGATKPPLTETTSEGTRRTFTLARTYTIAAAMGLTGALAVNGIL